GRGGKTRRGGTKTAQGTKENRSRRTQVASRGGRRAAETNRHCFPWARRIGRTGGSPHERGKVAAPATARARDAGRPCPGSERVHPASALAGVSLGSRDGDALCLLPGAEEERRYARTLRPASRPGRGPAVDS